MVTMAKAIRELMEKSESGLTSDEIKRAVEDAYPNQWKPTTLQAHLYACAVNNPKAYIHHPYATKFLYKNNNGTFELYSEEKHGPNEWAPSEGEDDFEASEELVEASISLERDIEDHLVDNLDAIEPGLKFIARQYPTAIGRIDILAEDREGVRVVIEVKVGDAKDSVVGQIARYLGWFARQDGRVPRGIVVASGFPDGVKYAATMISGLRLLSYQVKFSFEEARI